MVYNKITKKGFTLMELLVTVIIVSILASYAVYHYTNIMDEGRVNAAKGKLAGLGGATARFLLENAENVSTDCGYGDDGTSLEAYMSDPQYQACRGEMNDLPHYMLDVVQCGYAEKSLVRDTYYDYYIACPGSHGCGNLNIVTAYMRLKGEYAGNANFPACVYFDPATDRVVEVE